MTNALAVLAHQGGWDETLIVIGAVVVLFLLWKLLDRIRGTPTEPHRWDRDRGEPGAPDTADDDARTGEPGTTDADGHTNAERDQRD